MYISSSATKGAKQNHAPHPAPKKKKLIMYKKF